MESFLIYTMGIPWEGFRWRMKLRVRGNICAYYYEQPLFISLTAADTRKEKCAVDLKCQTRHQATGADGSEQVRDRETRPATLQMPDKNLVSSEIRGGRSVKQCLQHSLAKVLLGTWSRTAEREAFACTKGFRRRIGFSPAQALHQCLPFLWHVSTVSPPLRANTGIRVSDDKSLGGNVRKWGFLQMKVFLTHSLFTADGSSSGGQNPAEGDL